MTLDINVYKEFEDVVGIENICDDPLIMPAYKETEFAAVIMPKNTAEVAAIVKLCNKHKIIFRPICTGWTGVFVPGSLLIDLRRMNHIIEINEKNMYAVVEPYVISAELQAETFKKGLHFCVKGAGTNTSAMLRGHGHLDETTSGDDRNHLAVEWVSPEGEIIHTGSLGSSCEWFSGDGPGPSLRAVLTSAVPPGVSPGIFTKAAVKLYHWPGPAAYPIEGLSPKYTLKEIPVNMIARYYSFPSIDKMFIAETKIGESEIALELMGFNPAMVAANITTCNEEFFEVFGRINKEVKGPGFFIIIAGTSTKDFVFKKKVLEKIVADNDGQSLKPVEDPEIEGILLAQCTRISASIRETFRSGGTFKSIPIMGQRDLNIKWAIGAGKAKMPLIQKGLILDDGGGFFGWGVEQGHLGKTEIFCAYNPGRQEAVDAVLQWRDEQKGRAVKERYFAETMDNSEEVSKDLCNYLVWWRKIHKALDPNDVSPEAGSLV
jgi:glycolate oxidase